MTLQHFVGPFVLVLCDLVILATLQRPQRATKPNTSPTFMNIWQSVAFDTVSNTNGNHNLQHGCDNETPMHSRISKEQRIHTGKQKCVHIISAGTTGLSSRWNCVLFNVQALFFLVLHLEAHTCLLILTRMVVTRTNAVWPANTGCSSASVWTSVNVCACSKLSLPVVTWSDKRKVCQLQTFRNQKTTKKIEAKSGVSISDNAL